jgi:hypothetical protein
MHIRPLVPMGLALFISTGCQSYFPYGYGNNNPYPPMSGTYAPQGTTAPSGNAPPANSSGTGQYPTPANGQMNLGTGQTRGQSPKGQKAVPTYPDAGAAPASLGAPASEDDDADSIRKGRSSNDGGAKRTDDSGDEPEASLSSLDDEHYLSPTPYRAASATSDDPAVRRPLSKPRSSPYKKDPAGYKWLRGVVVRDPKSKSWRITYSRNPLDNDPYGGSLTLVDDESLDTLMDDDVVVVEGRIDPSAPDKNGKPSYRVTRATPVVPKDE